MKLIYQYFLKNLISKLFIDDYYSLLFGKCQENRGCIHPLRLYNHHKFLLYYVINKLK